MAYNQFFKFIEPDIKNIVEVGTCHGMEAIELEKHFKDATIHTFEADPKKHDNLDRVFETSERIVLHKYGLGADPMTQTFYEHISCSGANSFYDRFKSSDMRAVGQVEVRRLDECVDGDIDFLCMDCQGFELNVLVGAGKKLNKIKNIVLEMPNGRAQAHLSSCHDVPEGNDSPYMGAPDHDDVLRFMYHNGYDIKHQVRENDIEDNVLFFKSHEGPREF